MSTWNGIHQILLCHSDTTIELFELDNPLQKVQKLLVLHTYSKFFDIRERFEDLQDFCLYEAVSAVIETQARNFFGIRDGIYKSFHSMVIIEEVLTLVTTVVYSLNSLVKLSKALSYFLKAYLIQSAFDENMIPSWL